MCVRECGKRGHTRTYINTYHSFHIQISSAIFFMKTVDTAPSGGYDVAMQPLFLFVACCFFCIDVAAETGFAEHNKHSY